MLASAIEQGIDPDTTYYISAPFTCTIGPWCQTPWEVHTYENTYAGADSMTRATLALRQHGLRAADARRRPRYVWQMAHRLGVHLSPDKPVASIGLGSLAVSPLDMASAYATFPAMGDLREADGDHEGDPSRRPRRHRLGLGQAADEARCSREGVAWKVNDVLRQNALYGTGAGSGDGIHVNAGKTGTTDNHADAWFDGYTRQLATVVWMGYPKGEIPMLNVHGVAVAGATFPVPIWHEYMAAALWHHTALGFDLPDKYPTWHYLTRGRYGSFGRTTADDYRHDVGDDDDRDDLRGACEACADNRRTEGAGAHDDRPAAPAAPDHRAGSHDDGVAADDHRVAPALPWPKPVARSPRRADARARRRARRRRVAPGLTGRAAARRSPRQRHRPVPRALRRRVRRVPGRARPRAPRRAVHARLRPRVRDPARAARRADVSLVGRVDVLELRARARSVQQHAVGRPRRGAVCRDRRTCTTPRPTGRRSRSSLARSG